MYRQFLAVLALSVFLCPALNAADKTQQLERALELAASKAAASNKDVMNDNILLTVDFKERGSREGSDVALTIPLNPDEYKKYDEQYKNSGKIYIDGYLYYPLFTYEATEEERRSEEYKYQVFPGSNYNNTENGKYYIESEDLLKGRRPVYGQLWSNGLLVSPAAMGTIGCKAYALGPQWVITSGTCPIDTYDSSLLVVGGITYEERTDRKILDISLNGMAINSPFYKQQGNITLFYVPQDKNPAMSTFLGKQKTLKIMAFSKPQNIFALNAFGKFFVHTSRGGALVKDKTSAELKQGSLREGGIFQASSWYNGTATDPLFFTVNNQEYLTAYNAAPESYMLRTDLDSDFHAEHIGAWDGKASDFYYALNTKDLDFIRQTISAQDPAGWEQIKGQFFLDNPNTPYFK